MREIAPKRPGGASRVAAVPIVALTATFSCSRAHQGQNPRAEGDRTTVAAAIAPAAPTAATPSTPERSIHVLAPSMDVRAAASASAALLGTVRAGARLPLVDGTPAGRDGCPGGWVAVRPRGFVCEAEGATTRDANAPAVRVLSEYRFDSHAALPAEYGFAETTPIYWRIPTYDEQTLSEPTLAAHLRKRTELLENVRAVVGEAKVDDEDDKPVGVEVPDDLRGGAFVNGASAVAPKSPVAGAVRDGTPVAWIAELDAGGRTWLLLPDLEFVPRDRVRRAIVPGFHGIEPSPGEDRIAFVVGKPRAKYHMARYGWLMPGEDRWPVGAVVDLDDDVK